MIDPLRRGEVAQCQEAAQLLGDILELHSIQPHLDRRDLLCQDCRDYLAIVTALAAMTVRLGHLIQRDALQEEAP